MKYLFVVTSCLLLIYMMMPGPSSVVDFGAFPDSSKSSLSGDTFEIPNVAAYYSNHYRNYVTDFYKTKFESKTTLPFSPIKLNYPPEFAFTAILDQTKSTYLEEYVYPLRESLFVNGFEPFDETTKEQRFKGGALFESDGIWWETKTNIRYYPSSLQARFITWAGITLATFLLWRFGKKVIFE